MTIDETQQPDAPMGGDDGFAVAARRADERAVVEMAGELDLAGADQAISAARSVLDAQPLPTSLEIDTGGLDFMDSSGIAALLRIRALASAADVPFAITKASAPVQRVIVVTGLDDILLPHT